MTTVRGARKRVVRTRRWLGPAARVLGVLLGTAALAALPPAAALAAPLACPGSIDDYLPDNGGVAGAQLFGLGGEVRVIMCGAESVFDNKVSLSSPFATGVLLDDEATPIGTEVLVGTVGAGVEIIFKDAVDETGDGSTEATWFSGLASNNSDGLAHTMILGLGSDAYLVGFEDIKDGGDLDYDDIVFIVTIAEEVPPIEAPEPGSLLLLGAGLGALAGIAWNRSRRR